MAKTGSELRRAVTPWGSYAWGYADVGADIYVALGAVVGIAAGAANIAFGFAGLVYVCIGLAYTELAAAYPIAGGGQFFVTRALGDFMGFVAGWAVLLDFTIDISLFAWFTVGYVSSPRLIPWLAAPGHHPYYFVCVLAVAGFLTWINVVGVKQSSRINEVVAAVDVCTETFILACGFLFAWHPDLLVHTMQQHWPATNDLLKGVSFAIVSFVGLESISQAAEETQRPSAVMPRTSVALILTILIFALAYSNLVLGMHGPVDANGHETPLYAFLGNSQNNDKAIALLAGMLPYVGRRACLHRARYRRVLAHDLEQLRCFRRFAHRLLDGQVSVTAVAVPADQSQDEDPGRHHSDLRGRRVGRTGRRIPAR